MFKKALIASAVLAASTGLAFANGGTYAPPAPHYTHNIYIGVGVSRDFVHFDTSQHWGIRLSNPNNANDFIEANRNTQTDLGDDGWDGKIYGGIGWVFQDHYYLGLEAFGSISDADAIHNDNTTFKFSFSPDTGSRTLANLRKKLELKHSYGIGVIPGVKLNDSTMLYANISWVRSKFDVSESVTFPALSAFLGHNKFDQNISCNKSESGIMLGVGLETMVTNNVSTRIEYDWSRYGSIDASVHKKFSQSFNGGGANVELWHSINVDNPTINRVEWDVAYHFMSA